MSSRKPQHACSIQRMLAYAAGRWLHARGASIAMLLATTAIVAPARATTGFGEACGDLGNAYGPFDYRTDKDKLPVVEKHHFAVQVETLKSGQSSYIGDDLDYVLRAFPNHLRALIAMTRLAQKEGRAVPEGARYSVDCYFARALRFRPKDIPVRMAYAIFLRDSGKPQDALRQFEVSRELGARGADIDYELGLTYFDLGDFEKALSSAHRAYQGGITMLSLKLKLTRAGRWREPEATLPSAPPSGTRRSDRQAAPSATR